MHELPKTGQVFNNRYKLLELLGTGGIGSVFKANQIDCDRIVALKIIHPEIMQDEDMQRRFLQEAKALNELQHSGIVSVYHVGQSEAGLPYIAMEYIQGNNVRQLLVELRKLPLERALHITKQAARALAYVHSKNIVHRDLKPENIVVLEQPEPDTVKIIDFGLSRFLQEQKSTKTGSLIGTPHYMSPEQCTGHEVDHRSDVYSLAICFFEMLTGIRPFDADSPIGIIYKQINEPLPALSAAQINADPKALNAFLSRATAKDRTQRIQSMSEFIEEIESISVIEPKEGERQFLNFGKVSSLIALLSLLALLLIPAARWLLERRNPATEIRKNAVSESGIDVPLLIGRNGMPYYISLAQKQQIYKIIAALDQYQKKHRVPRSDKMKIDSYYIHCYCDLKKPETAIPYLERFPIDSFEFNDGVMIIAHSFRRLNRMDSALQLIRDSQSKLKDLPALWADLKAEEGDCYLELKQYKKSAECYLDALKTIEDVEGIYISHSRRRYEAIISLARLGRTKDLQKVIGDAEDAAVKDGLNTGPSVTAIDPKFESLKELFNDKSQKSAVIRRHLAESLGKNSAYIAYAFARAESYDQARHYGLEAKNYFVTADRPELAGTCEQFVKNLGDETALHRFAEQINKLKL
jgi:serine/threonine protein kinase